MAFQLLAYAPLLELGKTLLDKFGPEDKVERAKAEAEFLRMASQGDLAKVLKQLEINAIEAASPRLWVSGWRPYFGWIGGTGFGYAVLLQPMLTWVSRIKGWPEPPILDTELLLVVVGGLLGLGSLRSFDKTKGTTK